jgi:hypothetical protein
MHIRKVGEIELPQHVALGGTMICPNCGDSKFGSSQLKDGTLIRTCHGWINGETACTFKWLANEDHKYFYVSLAHYLEEKHAPGDV